MNGLTRSIREKANQFIFTGRAEFDDAEIRHIDSILASGVELTSGVEAYIEELQEEDTNIFEAAVDVMDSIDEIKKMCEVNSSLPEHFAKAFIQALDKVRQDVMEIKANTIGEIVAKLAAEASTNGIEE